jgi:YbbR domain-containing protein
VNKVSQVRARISLANASGSFQELLPLEALDDLGRPVSGLTLQPAQAQISVTIQRRLNALDVGVRAITENSPPAGYWLSDLRVTPASLTLQGDPSQLAELESYVDTLPIDISQASGDFTMDIPLNLPPSIQAVDSAGITRKTVTVTARITPRQGDLVLTKEVELLGSTRNIRLSIDPPEVELLLSGHLPLLNEIETDPNLVQVFINLTDLKPGQNVDTVPTILAPGDIQIQVVPPSVLVTLPEQ